MLRTCQCVCACNCATVPDQSRSNGDGDARRALGNRHDVAGFEIGIVGGIGLQPARIASRDDHAAGCGTRGDHRREACPRRLRGRRERGQRVDAGEQAALARLLCGDFAVRAPAQAAEVRRRRAGRRRSDGGRRLMGGEPVAEMRRRGDRFFDVRGGVERTGACEHDGQPCAAAPLAARRLTLRHARNSPASVAN